MKTTFLKTIGAMMMTILMLATFAQIHVSAQNIITEEKTDEQTQEDMSLRRANAKQIVGTWDTQTTIRNCQTGAAIRTFPSIGTFNSGGTFLDSSSGIPQALKTPGQGIWSYIGRNTYRFKFKSFSFDANGNFTGWTIISHEAYLNRWANTYESTGTAMIYAPNGSLVAIGCSTTTATRFE